MKCLELEQILDYTEGRLDKTEAGKIKTHLNACSSCQNTAEWAATTIKSIASRELVDAPEYLIHRAIQIFPAKKSSFADWVMAKLSFDTALTPALAGMRSAETEPRQRVFETYTHKIILMSETGSEGIRWTGQIVANQPDAETAGCLVELAKGKKIVVHSTTNQNGEFTMSSPKGTRFDLRIHTEPQSFIVPNLS